MASEVKHGKHPTFKVALGRGWYGLRIRGHYTKTPGLTAVGVTEVRWNSNRRGKQQAELLGMRTAFVCWFMREWMRTGGKWAPGVKHITEYPWRRLRKRLRKGWRYIHGATFNPKKND